MCDVGVGCLKNCDDADLNEPSVCVYDDVFYTYNKHSSFNHNYHIGRIIHYHFFFSSLGNLLIQHAYDSLFLMSAKHSYLQLLSLDPISVTAISYQVKWVRRRVMFDTL